VGTCIERTTKVTCSIPASGQGSYTVGACGARTGGNLVLKKRPVVRLKKADMLILALGARYYLVQCVEVSHLVGGGVGVVLRATKEDREREKSGELKPD